VAAHPDDESFGLGAVLTWLAAGGCQISVLCLTRGEASGLHGVPGELAAIRQRELAAAASELGLVRVELRDYPDGGLTGAAGMVEAVAEFVAEAAPDGLVVFDDNGVTGHADHVAATAAATRAAEALGLPVLAWTLPAEVAASLNQEFGTGFAGHPERELQAIPVDRGRQRAAIDCHRSQAVPGSVLWRRLELLGDREYLRWLRPG